jgi:hypothetical protein
MVGVRIVTFSILAPCPGAIVAFAALGVYFNAAAYERAEKGILRSCGVVAVNGTEVVPERVVGRFQVIFNLYDARRGDVEVW